MFSSFGPHLDIFQSFIGCFVETRNYNILSLAFNASSFRVTEENLVFETVQSGPYSSLNVFSALKGTHFYILYNKSKYEIDHSALKKSCTCS